MISYPPHRSSLLRSIESRAAEIRQSRVFEDDRDYCRAMLCLGAARRKAALIFFECVSLP